MILPWWLPLSSWTSERARVASLTRSREPDDPDLLAARDALAAARTELQVARAQDYVQRLVDAAPPLSADQRSRLAALLLASPVAAA